MSHHGQTHSFTSSASSCYQGSWNCRGSVSDHTGQRPNQAFSSHWPLDVHNRCSAGLAQDQRDVVASWVEHILDVCRHLQPTENEDAVLATGDKFDLGRDGVAD